MDTIQYLSNKVHLLELKIDSLQKAESIKELSLKINEQADIVSNVGGFYENAWIKLIFVITLLAGVFAIVVPILIQHFQKSNLKEVTDFLSKEVKEVFDLKIKNMQELNKTQFDVLSSKIDNELSAYLKKYNSLSFEIEASLYYLQGKQIFATNNYGAALKDFIKSAEYWAKSSRPERGEVLLQNIDLCIKKLKTRAIYEKTISINSIDIKSFMELMENRNNYEETLKQIRTSINELEN